MRPEENKRISAAPSAAPKSTAVVAAGLVGSAHIDRRFLPFSHLFFSSCRQRLCLVEEPGKAEKLQVAQRAKNSHPAGFQNEQSLFNFCSFATLASVDTA